MRGIGMDVRWALRQLRSQPLLAAVAVLTLGLGIGANTAIFTVVNGLLLRPLPYEDSERLVLAFQGSMSSEMLVYADGELLDAWRETSGWLSGIEAYNGGSQYVELESGQEFAEAQTASVTAGYFELVRLEPVLGRDLEAGDEQAGAAPVALMGWGFWQRAYGGRRDVVGEVLRVEGEAYRVVGIAAREASIPTGRYRDPEVWLPMKRGEDGVYTAPGLAVLGRLADGATLERAQAELAPVTERIANDSKLAWTAKLVRPQDMLGANTRNALYVLLGAVGLVLLVACANVANLMLTRTLARSSELAVRGALGAGRSRLVRQLLIESLMFAALGGLLGVGVARMGLDTMIAHSPDVLLRELERVRMDGRVLAFASALTLLTTMLFGVGPAVRASRSALSGLARAGHTGARDSRRGRAYASVLVASEIALSVVLMVGAGLLVRALLRLMHQDVGFQQEGLVAATFELPRSRYPRVSFVQSEARRAFFEQLRDAAGTLPGVEGAILVMSVPPEYGISFGALQVDGRGLNEPPQILATNYVGAEYIPLLGLRILEGRAFDAAEVEARNVVVIGESVARRYFAHRSSIGERIRISTEGDWLTVVGVAADIPAQGLARSSTALPQLHMPHVASFPEETLLVRTARDPAVLREALASIAARIDQTIDAPRVESLTAMLAESLERERFNLMLMATFATLAVLLSAIGLYGVVSHTVGQRRREIGIRRALGAEDRGIVGLIVRQGMQPVLIGIMIGLVAAALLAQIIDSLLFGLDPHDPVTFAGVPLVLTSVAVLACLVPARRATRIEPFVALRTDA